MSALLVFLALLPIFVIFALLVFKKTAADLAGMAGWAVAVLVAWWFFRTPLSITLRISLAGVLASLPITLMVAASIFQISVMLETGAIARLVSLIKTVSPKSQVAQIMILNVGFGTLLAALGATPVSILPPIMLGLGYTSFVAIALPAIGYDALCTYALLGIPVVVFANFVGLPVNQVGGYFARFMPVISTCIGLGMLWIVGGWKLVRKGIVPTLVAGGTAGGIAILMNRLGMVTLTGVAAGLGVIVAMLVYLKLIGQPLRDKAVLNEKDSAAINRISLPAAVSPWLFLTFFAVVVNAPFLPFFRLTFVKLAMPVTIIPGSPEKIRLLWQAYFWILVSTFLALPFLKPRREQMKTAVQKFWKRAPRPMLASAVFFAIAFIINHSGKGADWKLVDPMHNMVYVVAAAAAGLFHKFYPVVAPYLGLLGGFVSGSETSAIAMLTALHISAAQKIGALGILVAAASGIGGGLASVISPAKLQNAAASIDRIGEESRVIPKAFMISIIITGICAVMAFYWAY